MPLTHAGLSVLAELRKKHGDKKGESIFYASINKGVPGSEKWEGKGLGRLKR